MFSVRANRNSSSFVQQSANFIAKPRTLRNKPKRIISGYRLVNFYVRHNRSLPPTKNICRTAENRDLNRGTTDWTVDITWARRQTDVLKLVQPTISGLRSAPGGDVAGATDRRSCRRCDEHGAGAASQSTHLEVWARGNCTTDCRRTVKTRFGRNSQLRTADQFWNADCTALLE